jgi:hypothetical protein
MMNPLKLRGDATPRSESFVELRIDDLVKESVTWSPQAQSSAGFSEPLPNVIHGLLRPSELH